MTNIPFTYREMTISSAQMEVPRESYQRNFNVNRAKRIADEFDERIEYSALPEHGVRRLRATIPVV